MTEDEEAQVDGVLTLLRLGVPEVLRPLPNGQMLAVWPLLFGRGQVVIGKDGHDVERAWDFPTLELAVHQYVTWDGEQGEPEGWDRAYPPLYRRRPDGDASKEYVAP